MSISDFFKQPDIHKGLKEYEETENAVLLDVHTPQESREGHIPGSKNIPLQTIDKVASVTENKDTVLQHMGYTNVTNIGGIAAYQGKVER